MPPTSAASSASGSPADAHRRAGLAAACIGTVFWGSAAVLGKAVDAHAFVMLTWRQLIAIAALGGFIVATRHRVTVEQLRRSWYAAAFFGLHLIGFFQAARYTSVAIVVLIYALAPVLIIPLAALRMGERPTKAMVVLAVVAVAGVSLVVLGDTGERGSRPLLGFLMSVGNLVLWVWWNLRLKRARMAGVDPLAWLLAANIGGFIVVLIAALVAGQDITAVETGDWWRIAALAVGSGLLGHGLNTWALRHIPVGLASIIGLGEPVLSALGAALFLSESLRWPQSLGIAIVIAAVALAVARER